MEFSVPLGAVNNDARITSAVQAAAQRVLGDDHRSTINSIRSLVRLYEAWGKPDEAAKWRKLLDG